MEGNLIKMAEENIKLWTADAILDALQANAKHLRELSVSRIGLFGSYCRNAAGLESDIDFLVVLDRLTFDNYMDVRFFLEDLFGCTVDLVLEDNLKPRLRPFIMEEAIYAQGL